MAERSSSQRFMSFLKALSSAHRDWWLTLAGRTKERFRLTDISPRQVRRHASAVAFHSTAAVCTVHYAVYGASATRCATPVHLLFIEDKIPVIVYEAPFNCIEFNYGMHFIPLTADH